MEEPIVEDSGEDLDGSEEIRKRQPKRHLLDWVVQYAGLMALVLMSVNLIFQQSYRVEARGDRERSSLHALEQRVASLEEHQNNLVRRIQVLEQETVRSDGLLSAWSKELRQTKRVLPPIRCEQLAVGASGCVVLMETPDGASRIQLYDRDQKQRALLVAQKDGVHLGFADRAGNRVVHLQWDETIGPEHGAMFTLKNGRDYVSMHVHPEQSVLDIVNNEHLLGISAASDALGVSMSPRGRIAEMREKMFLIARKTVAGHFAPCLAVGTDGRGIGGDFDGPLIAVGRHDVPAALFFEGQKLFREK